MERCGEAGGGGEGDRTSRSRRAFCQRSRGDDRSLDGGRCTQRPRPVATTLNSFDT